MTTSVETFVRVARMTSHVARNNRISVLHIGDKVQMQINDQLIFSRRCDDCESIAGTTDNSALTRNGYEKFRL